MESPADARTVSVSIERSASDVYELLRHPASFPLWASGLGSTLEPGPDGWTMEGPEGPVTVRFSDRNDYGVLDHTVVVGPGVEVHMPMRVVANRGGSEVLLTVFRQPGMTDEMFERDVEWVRRDLATLAGLIEGGELRSDGTPRREEDP
jgi:hypothetical protein